MTAKFTTRTEAIENVILAPLGEWAKNFDTEGIADEVLEWVDGLGANPDHPNDVWLPAQGFKVAVDTEQFWKIVQRHEFETVWGATHTEVTAAARLRELIAENERIGASDGRVTEAQALLAAFPGLNDMGRAAGLIDW